MTSPKAPKDKIFEKVINPYLTGVLQQPQSIEMRERMLHIRDVEVPKKTVSMEARLEAMEQQVFKCQGMVEHGLNANQMKITEFTNKHKIDANDIGKHLSRFYDRIDHLQAQIYDLQKQNSIKLLSRPKTTKGATASSKSAESGSLSWLGASVGTKVFLKSLIKHNRDVALATIMSCDPKFKLDGDEIGNEYWVVHVDMALVKTENLVRSRKDCNTLDDDRFFQI
ncbi:40S ribosomal protein S5-1 [Hordeum vulgare]|nr:40S ribosomal protein S5-1 [Hordeum vulgare]